MDKTSRLIATVWALLCFGVGIRSLGGENPEGTLLCFVVGGITVALLIFDSGREEGRTEEQNSANRRIRELFDDDKPED